MKKQATLTPEKYITTRSRNLEIYKCFVLEGWEDAGITQVLITRKHSNGNISACFYLVDLFCLGIKDTMFHFNKSEDEIFELLERNEINYAEIDYNLAHNIIFASYEYALDIGIKQHSDFEKITKYFLEVDDEKIPIIDIVCGQNGKPFYIQGLENATKAKKVIKTLEQNLGSDGFEYTLLVDDSFEGDYFEGDINETLNLEIFENFMKTMEQNRRELDQLNFTEKRKMFLDSVEKNSDSDSFPFDESSLLLDSLELHYLDDNKILNCKKSFQFLTEIKNENLDSSILGSTEVALFDEAEEILNEVLQFLVELDLSESKAGFMELMETFQEDINYANEKYPNLPLTKYVNARIDLFYENNLEVWQKLLSEHPNYKLFIIENYISKNSFEDVLSFSEVFSENKEISSAEIYRYLFALLKHFEYTKDLNKLNAMQELIKEIDLYEEEISILSTLAIISIEQIVKEKLIKNELPTRLKI